MSSDAPINAWENIPNSNKLHYTQNSRCICSYQNRFYHISSVLSNKAKANVICGVHFKVGIRERVLYIQKFQPSYPHILFGQ